MLPSVNALLGTSASLRKVKKPLTESSAHGAYECTARRAVPYSSEDEDVAAAPSAVSDTGFLTLSVVGALLAKSHGGRRTLAAKSLA